jgi:hypothetical protein
LSSVITVLVAVVLLKHILDIFLFIR